MRMCYPTVTTCHYMLTHVMKRDLSADSEKKMQQRKRNKETMNILIEVTPKEIADLVREVQGQPTLSIDSDVIAHSLQLATRDIAKAVSRFSETKRSGA